MNLQAFLPRAIAICLSAAVTFSVLASVGRIAEFENAAPAYAACSPALNIAGAQRATERSPV